ncbi:hypothetical protein B0H13DRAFT_1993956 [Mycena leptocephala]|nr:hypothetical protein B0H13DRAFT_1993956 [Mycena leptocephala]
MSLYEQSSEGMPTFLDSHCLLHSRSSAGTVSDGPSKNWYESWGILRATLEGLEEGGMDPHSAILRLLNIEMPEERPILDTSSVAQFKGYLQTNYVPSESERDLIKEFCAQGSQKLSRISMAIETHRARLTILRREYDSLVEVIEPYKALIAPMRALLPELLQEIFIRCLPTRHYAVMHTSQAPLLFGRVCSAWRSVSLSTAALWSSVHVAVNFAEPFFTGLPVDNGYADTNPSTLERCQSLQTWLQHAGHCPLSISLFFPSRFKEKIQPFMDVIMPYSHRWKALKLIQVTHEQLPGLWSLHPEDVPLLEVLEISDLRWGGEHDLDSLRFFRIPPNLSSIALDYSSSHMNIPVCSWDRITSLRLGPQMSFFNLGPSQTVDLLAQCINLQTCRLSLPINSNAVDNAPSTSISRQITLSHLHTLSVDALVLSDIPFNIASILDHLTLPALQNLAIGSVSRFDDIEPGIATPILLDTMVILEKMLVRSSCALRELRIRDVLQDLNALLRCLRGLPGLERLDLHRVSLDLVDASNLVPFLTELVASASSPGPPLCPKLHHLGLINWDVDTGPDTHLFLKTLIESRCQNPPHKVPPLLSVEVFLIRHPIFDTTEFSQAMLPSKVKIVGPPVSSRWKPEATCWQGIPLQDRDMIAGAITDF